MLEANARGSDGEDCCHINVGEDDWKDNEGLSRLGVMYEGSCDAVGVA